MFEMCYTYFERRIIEKMEIDNMTFKGVEELSILELKSTVTKCNTKIGNLEKELDKIVSLRDYKYKGSE